MCASSQPLHLHGVGAVLPRGRGCKSGAVRATGALQRDRGQPGQSRRFFGTGDATAQDFRERAKAKPRHASSSSAFDTKHHTVSGARAWLRLINRISWKEVAWKKITAHGMSSLGERPGELEERCFPGPARHHNLPQRGAQPSISHQETPPLPRLLVLIGARLRDSGGHCSAWLPQFR